MTLRSDDPNVTIQFLEWVIQHLQHVLTMPNTRERRVAADSVTITVFKHLKDYLPLELRALVSTILELEETAWQPMQFDPPADKRVAHRPFPWLARKHKQQAKGRKEATQPPQKPRKPVVRADHQVNEAVLFLREREGQEEKDLLGIGIISAIFPPDGQRPTCYLLDIPEDQTMCLVRVHQILA